MTSLFAASGMTASPRSRPSYNSGADLTSTARVAAASEKCPDARKAVRYYGRKLGEWRVKMGAAKANSGSTGTGKGCPHVRRLAHTLQHKAHDARLRYENFVYYHYRWDHWLPAKFFRVARCETGSGGVPRWDWDSGTYVSAFGILRSAYAQFAHALGIPAWDERGLHSPREQYRVAAAIQARYGWSAWGCGGA